MKALRNGHAIASFKGVQLTRRQGMRRARLVLFAIVGEGLLSPRRATPAT